MKFSLGIFLSVCVVLSALMCGQSEGFTFQVDAHKEECFIQQVKQQTSVGVRFQVTSGGFLDVDVKITGPDSIIIYAGERENEGKYSFVAHTTGPYTFCFSNKMSTLTPKVVSFQLNLGAENAAKNPATKENLTPLENSILQLADGLRAVQDEQNYMKLREQVHRDTSESNNSRVVWWTLFEAMWIVSIGVWQLYTLRRLFSTTGPV
mmetsp:Transcript_2711/g.3940  ORF Transcript_2711/g.3940 Transcript_2711/m.3940 type:complete len:207 (-) Transcript_2711:577-1197(-)